MIEALGSIIAGLLDAFLFRGDSADRRTYEAYKDAWRVNGRHAESESIELLRNKFKEHSAPGAYVDPDGIPLASWLASWRSGQAPRTALRGARRAGRYLP